MSMDNHYIKDRFRESMIVKNSIIEDDVLLFKIDLLAKEMATTLKNGGKILLCGNGGSATITQQIASQLAGIFYYDRPPLNVEALHTNSSYITSISNQYSFDEVYARMILAQGNPGDMLIAVSASGDSKNVINALNMANRLGMKTIGLTGEDPRLMSECSGDIISVPSGNRPRINETHLLIGNILCEIVESILYKKS
jgi:D-sedoheptulose 7-phosphate isomerase